MTPLGRLAAAALLVAIAGAAGCDWFAPRPPRGAFSPGPSGDAEVGCEVCGAPQRHPAVIYRVEAPATIQAGQAAAFTIYAAAGTDEAVICEVPQPAANLPGWGVDAGQTPPRLKLGLVMKGVQRDESRPCPVVDRAAPPRSVKATRRITFPAPGTYAVEVVGYDGTRPLGMIYSPAPGDPPAPPKPSFPATLEVVP